VISYRFPSSLSLKAGIKMQKFYLMQSDASDDDDKPINETLVSDQQKNIHGYSKLALEVLFSLVSNHHFLE
jgi:hypothetical protein